MPPNEPATPKKGRRKSAPSPAFVPAVGDMCEGVNGVTGQTERGEFVRFGVYNERGFPGEPTYECACLERAIPEGGGVACVTRSSLKPAPAPVYFGTQPKDDELPATIPAGSVWVSIDDPEERFTFRSEAHLTPIEPGSNARPDRFGYIGASSWDDTQEAEVDRDEADEDGKEYQRSPVPASLVAWDTVPRPSQKAVPAPLDVGMYVRHKREPSITGRIVSVDATPAGPLFRIAPPGETRARWAYAREDIEKLVPVIGTLSPAEVTEKVRAYRQETEPGQSPPDPWGIPREACAGPHDFDLLAGYCRECGVTALELEVAKPKRDERYQKGGLSDAWIAAYMSGADETYLESDRSLRAQEDRQATEREAGVKHPSDWDVDDVEELTVS